VLYDTSDNIQLKNDNSKSISKKNKKQSNPSLFKSNIFSAAPLGLRLGVGFYPGLRCGLAATLALGCNLSTASRPFSKSCFVTNHDLAKKSPNGAKEHSPGQAWPSGLSAAPGKVPHQDAAPTGRQKIGYSQRVRDYKTKKILHRINGTGHQSKGNNFEMLTTQLH